MKTSTANLQTPHDHCQTASNLLDRHRVAGSLLNVPLPPRHRFGGMLASILVALQGALSQELPRPELTFDAGDSYTLPDGSKASFLQATGEIAVKRVRELPSAGVLSVVDESAGAVSSRVLGTLDSGGPYALDIYQVLDSATAIAELSKLDQVAYAVPVLVEPRSGLRAIPGDEIIVRLRDDAKAEDVFGRLAQDGLEVVEAPKPESPGHWLLRLVEPKGRNVLAEASSVSAAPDVAWAEPNLLLELEFYTIPNDQLFGRQQYLRNTGQNGALAGADIDAASVWDVTTGSGSIVIAILDTGVDTEHNDLKLNIFNNPNEKEFGRDANGVDDDANGYIDDWRGWDFGWDNFSNDNNPNPGTSASAAHGTACAGIAAAMGNNTFGTAGVAYGCKILPIKMIADDGLTFAQSWQLANAIS